MEQPMRVTACLAALTVLLLAGCADTRRSWHPLSFSKSEGTIGGHHIEIDFDDVEHNGRGFYLATKTDRVKGRMDQTSWADSGTCPAMMPALARLQLVEPFRVTPPGVPSELTEVVLDGDGYEVTTTGYWPHAGRDGGITLSGNNGTPVANWVEDAMKALAACWRTHRYPD